MSILDEIAILPPPVSLFSGWKRSARDWSLLPPIQLSRYAPSSIQLRSPWVLGAADSKLVGPHWKGLCRVLKSMGMAIQCAAAELEMVSMESVPIRICRQLVDAPLGAAEFQSADVVEVCLFAEQRRQWGWPPELGTEQNFADWVEAVRLTLGGSTPVAIGLPVGVDEPTIQKVLAARIDILSIHAETLEADELLVDCLARVQRALQQASSPALVWARSAHARVEHLIRLIGLGASMVSVDAALKELWKDAPEGTGGFLSSVRVGGEKSNEAAIADQLNSMNTALFDALDFHLVGETGDSPREELGQRLRATTDRASRIARIPWLGDAN